MDFRTRPVWQTVQLATNWLLLATPLAIVGGSAAGGSGALGGCVLAGVVAAVVALPSIRRRHLVADESGLTVFRNGFLLRTGWADLAGFEARRFLGLPVTMLRVDKAVIVDGDGAALTPSRLAKLTKSGADRMIQIGIYVPRVDEGPFGELLRQYRPDLVESAHQLWR